MRKRNHIQKLSNVLTATGLGLFIIAGFSGCDEYEYRSPNTTKHKEDDNHTFAPVARSGFFTTGSSVEHSGGG